VDGIKEMLDRLSELDEGQLSDLESKIIDEFGTVEKQEPTAQVVDQMTALADALDAVRGEQQSRVAAAQELQQRAAEAVSRVKPQQDEENPVEEAAPTEEPDTAPAQPTDVPPSPTAETPPVPETPAETPPTPDEAETPAEDAVPGEETDEEKKKKQAVPSTFAEDEKAPEASTSDPAPENEPSTPENEPSTPENEPAPPSNDTTTAEQPSSVPETTPAPVAVEPPTTPDTAPNEEIPVAASATDVVVTPPAENRPVPREHASVAITAGADIPGISAGTEMTSASQVADAFVKRLHNLQRVSQPNGQQYTVATLTASFPEDRVLEMGDVDGNWEKIQKVAGVEAIVAAAGACVPLEIRYDIQGVGDTDTPVQDSLPRFTADRGGIRFYPGPLLPSAEYYRGTGVWDPLGDPDTNVTPFDNSTGAGADGLGAGQAEKPCYPVQCLPFVEATLEAVTMCLCFDNLTGRVFPELVARHNELALVQHARVTEQYMLSKIKQQSTHDITATGSLAVPADILTQVDRVAAALRYRNRISPTQSFRVIMPYWIKDMIRSDLAMRMPGDGGSNFTAADNTLDGWFRARNINVTWSLESAFDADALGDIDDLASNCDWWPATVEWDMFAEGTWLVLDGGTLDLGVIRDAEHVANNTYCEFTESFYNVARVGGESVHVTSTLTVSGSAADLSDACSTSA